MSADIIPAAQVKQGLWYRSLNAAKRVGASGDEMAALAFGAFFFVILFVYIVLPALITMATTVITGLSAGEQGLVGAMGIVIIAVLLYGFYKHGT